MRIKHPLFWAILLLVGLGSPAQANPSEISAFRQILNGFASGFVPPEEDAPRKTTTAGSRNEGQCRGDNGTIRALTPPGNNYGLTVEERPILLLEMPQTQAQSVLLAFQSATSDDYSETILPILPADEQGLVQFQPPEEMAGLVMGETYQWTISVLCNGRLDPNNPLFSGWLQRTEPPAELAQALGNAPITEQINQLQKSGYWYDMLPLILNNQAQLGG